MQSLSVLFIRLRSSSFCHEDCCSSIELIPPLSHFAFLAYPSLHRFAGACCCASLGNLLSLLLDFLVFDLLTRRRLLLLDANLSFMLLLNILSFLLLLVFFVYLFLMWGSPIRSCHYVRLLERSVPLWFSFLFLPCSLPFDHCTESLELVCSFASLLPFCFICDFLCARLTLLVVYGLNFSSYILLFSLVYRLGVSTLMFQSPFICSTFLISTFRKQFPECGIHIQDIFRYSISSLYYFRCYHFSFSPCLNYILVILYPFYFYPSCLLSCLDQSCLLTRLHNSYYPFCYLKVSHTLPLPHWGILVLSQLQSTFLFSPD